MRALIKKNAQFIWGTKQQEAHWRPVNHTSRPWTPAESRYSQTERESNGIVTGMFMNHMYTTGCHVEVVNDHLPLIPIYEAKNTSKEHPE